MREQCELKGMLVLTNSTPHALSIESRFSRINLRILEGSDIKDVNGISDSYRGANLQMSDAAIPAHRHIVVPVSAMLKQDSCEALSKAAGKKAVFAVHLEVFDETTRLPYGTWRVYGFATKVPKMM